MTFNTTCPLTGYEHRGKNIVCSCVDGFPRFANFISHFVADLSFQNAEYLDLCVLCTRLVINDYFLFCCKFFLSNNCDNMFSVTLIQTKQEKFCNMCQMRQEINKSCEVEQYHPNKLQMGYDSCMYYALYADIILVRTVTFQHFSFIRVRYIYFYIYIFSFSFFNFFKECSVVFDALVNTRSRPAF